MRKPPMAGLSMAAIDVIDWLMPRILPCSSGGAFKGRSEGTRPGEGTKQMAGMKRQKKEMG